METFEIRDSRGVDLTLIRWFLTLTPAERIEQLDDTAEFVAEVWRLNGIEQPAADLENAR